MDSGFSELAVLHFTYEVWTDGPNLSNLYCVLPDCDNQFKECSMVVENRLRAIYPKLLKMPELLQLQQFSYLTVYSTPQTRPKTLYSITTDEDILRDKQFYAILNNPWEVTDVLQWLMMAGRGSNTFQSALVMTSDIIWC